MVKLLGYDTGLSLKEAEERLREVGSEKGRRCLTLPDWTTSISNNELYGRFQEYWSYKIKGEFTLNPLDKPSSWFEDVAASL